MDELISLAVSAAQTAGALLRKYYKKKYTISSKGPDNPVTMADLEANILLKEKLLGVCPDFGWLSEESADSTARLTKQLIWIVDPLDGTKEFIAERPEFMVSIGLAENGQSVLGVLYNPLTEELFCAHKGQGAFRNGQRIYSTRTSALKDALVVISRTEAADHLWQPWRHFFKDLQPCGSVAYKLAKVAAGAADLHISLKPKNEWDICAAHCLLNEAGAELRDRDGQPITYNRQNTTIPKGIMAGNNQLLKKVCKIPFADVCN